MRVQILPSDTSGSPGVDNTYAASIVINDRVALDAGCLGFHGDTERQSAVEHVFLSHAHLDHTASLPMFLENTFSNTADCATVYATGEVHQWLQEHMFNDRLWPDFVRLSTPESKLINCVTLVPGTPVEVAGLTVTPVAVNHGVPAMGFLVDDGTTAIAYSADTAETTELWELARANPRLRAVLLECAFPNSMTWLAEVSFHLTPRTFDALVRRFLKDVPVCPVLMKARFRAETVAELRALELPNLRFPLTGEVMEF